MKANIIWVLEEKEPSDTPWYPIEMHETRKEAREGQKWLQEHNKTFPNSYKYRIVKYVSQGVAE